MKNFTIKVRVDFEDTLKYDIMMQTVRDACQTILSTAMILQDRRAAVLTLDDRTITARHEDIDINAGFGE